MKFKLEFMNEIEVSIIIKISRPEKFVFKFKKKYKNLLYLKLDQHF